MDLLQIGVVGRAQGLRGELRVYLHDNKSHCLAALRRVFLAPDVGSVATRDSRFVEWSISSAKARVSGDFIVAFSGVPDRSAAEALTHLRVYADRSELPQLASDEVYLADLVGMRVSTVAGVAVGVVEGVLDANGHSLLVIRGAQDAEILVPAVPEILAHVDLSAGLVQIDPPSGLIE